MSSLEDFTIVQLTKNRSVQLTRKHAVTLPCMPTGLVQGRLVLTFIVGGLTVLTGRFPLKIFYFALYL